MHCVPYKRLELQRKFVVCFTVLLQQARQIMLLKWHWEVVLVLNITHCLLQVC